MNADENNRPNWFRQSVRWLVYALIIIVFAVVASYGLSSRSHRDYYGRTIRNVQTADFNMLSSTLATKLSFAMLQGNTAEIERTVNSNFGLFGMFVTDCVSPEGDCAGQKILYQSRWKRPATELVYDADMLNGHDFLVLRNPPPLQTEWQYSGPDPGATRILTGLTNSGMIIGRVYFVRSTPPRFADNFVRDWLFDNLKRRPLGLLTDAWTARNVRSAYSLNLIVGALVGAVIVLGIEMQRNARTRRLFVERERANEEERRKIAELRSTSLESRLRNSNEQEAMARQELQEAQRARADTLRELEEARGRGEAAEELLYQAAARERAVAEKEALLSETLQERAEIERLLGAQPGRTISEMVAALIESSSVLKRQNRSIGKHGERFRGRVAKWYESVTVERRAVDWVVEMAHRDPQILEEFERQLMLLNFAPARAGWSRNPDDKTRARTIYAPRDRYRIYVVEGDNRHYHVVLAGAAADPQKQRDHEWLAEHYPR